MANVPTALVGATGFVGSNLLRKRSFDLEVNSKNAAELAGRHFGRVVFSAARAEKWRANQDPEADAKHVDELKSLIQSFTADELVLVSTVDVYRDPRGVDESTEIDASRLQAYGRNRFLLEQAARAAHQRVVVVRLPALFGPGLKKNVIYDLLNDNQVERIDSAAQFQFYNLECLADDVDRISKSGLDLVNIAVAPLSVHDLARHVFGVTFDNRPTQNEPTKYDMRTLHSAVFGAEGPYAYDSKETLEALSVFVSAERAAK